MRLATAGSVDDGKSTLIGRLLFDSKQVLDRPARARRGGVARAAATGMVDLSLLVDGLRAEREQGITIDVAYRYFATARRTFIIADTPGHVQYTRNMVTGASTADLAVILVDARKGVLEQSKRHAFISSLLGIPHIVVAVNKMDLVDFDEEVFDAIVREFSDFAARPRASRDIAYIPISRQARRQRRRPLRADAVVRRRAAARAPRVRRRSPTTATSTTSRFPVQWVIRDHDDRLPRLRRPGRRRRPAPRRRGARCCRRARARGSRAIDTFDGPVDEAFAPMSVTLLLEDEIDVSRGDLICARRRRARSSRARSRRRSAG